MAWELAYAGLSSEDRDEIAKEAGNPNHRRPYWWARVYCRTAITKDAQGKLLPVVGDPLPARLLARWRANVLSSPALPDEPDVMLQRTFEALECHPVRGQITMAELRARIKQLGVDRARQIISSLGYGRLRPHHFK